MGFNNTYVGDFVGTSAADVSNTIRIGDISNGNRGRVVRMLPRLNQRFAVFEKLLGATESIGGIQSQATISRKALWQHAAVTSAGRKTPGCHWLEEEA